MLSSRVSVLRAPCEALCTQLASPTVECSRPLTAERCAAAFSPKVAGAWHLHRLTAHLDLAFFVLLSSVSGVTGMMGLASYAAANTFLDALSYLRRDRGLCASSLAYGMWAGDGMAERIEASTLTHLAQHGLGMLSPHAALRLLEQAVCSGRALSVAAKFDLRRLGEYHAEQCSVPSLYSNLPIFTANSTSSPFNLQTDLRTRLLRYPPMQHSRILLASVRETVAKALGFAKPEQLDISRPLREIGIDSLTAVLIRNKLANLTNLTLGARVVLQYKTLQDLTDFLSGELQRDLCPSTTESDGSATPTSAGSEEVSLSPYVDNISKGFLDPAFRFHRDPLVSRRSELVFVTGGTGFVGAFIVQGLLDLGINVQCLVRATSNDHAKQRIVHTLKSYQLWQDDYAPLLHAQHGDASKLLLGLSREDFDSVADTVDTICHAAALVDWMRPLENYLGPNVVSSHEVLRLASQGRVKTLHFVSTISTLSNYLGLAGRIDDGETGYGTSKFLAERMVAAARWRGLKAFIYRLPLVSASSITGHFRHDRGDFLHNFIVSCLDMDLFPSVNANLASIIPIDHLSATIVSMISQENPSEEHGQDFDFLNGQPQSLDDFSRKFTAAKGSTQGVVPFDAWKRNALAHAAAHPNGSAARIIAIIDGCDEVSFAATFTGLARSRYVFGVEDRPVPPMDDDYVRRYLSRIQSD